MKRGLALAVALIGIPLVCFLLGGLAGCFLYNQPGSGWVHLVQPPIKAIHIAWIGNVAVTVQTKDGQIYECDSQKCTLLTFAMPSEPVAQVLFTRDINSLYVQTVQGRIYVCSANGCGQSWAKPQGEIVEVWRGLFRVSTGQIYSCGRETCELTNPPTQFGFPLEAPRIQAPSSPVGQVIEHKAATCYNCESYVQWDALLMEDGGLWYWTIFRSNFPAALWFLVFGCGGLVGGVLISFVVATVALIRRNSSSPPSVGRQS